MGLDPSLPPSTCVHLSLTPPPPCGRHKWMAPYHNRILSKVLSIVHGRAVRRRHYVGGGAPVNFGRRRRRAAGPKKSAAAARRGRPKHFFSKIHEKISFYPQNLLRNL